MEVDGPDDCYHKNHPGCQEEPVIIQEQPMLIPQQPVFIPDHSVYASDKPNFIHEQPILYPEIDYNEDPSAIYHHQVAHSHTHHFEASNGVPALDEPPAPQVALNYLVGRYKSRINN